MAKSGSRNIQKTIKSTPWSSRPSRVSQHHPAPTNTCCKMPRRKTWRFHVLKLNLHRQIHSISFNSRIVEQLLYVTTLDLRHWCFFEPTFKPLLQRAQARTRMIRTCKNWFPASADQPTEYVYWMRHHWSNKTTLSSRLPISLQDATAENWNWRMHLESVHRLSVGVRPTDHFAHWSTWIKVRWKISSDIDESANKTQAHHITLTPFQFLVSSSFSVSSTYMNIQCQTESLKLNSWTTFGIF